MQLEKSAISSPLTARPSLEFQLLKGARPCVL
jgi:hypothetical protein